MATSLAVRSGVAVIKITSPPVNALGQAVRAGLLGSLKEAVAGGSQGIVIMGDGRTFPVGADITEFAGAGPSDPSFNALMNAFEACPVPSLAAIHGTALGGGFELALACRARCATRTARVGLPEVHLGLLPGAGGTQRLPRLVGVERALDMILSGRHVAAAEALEMGCIDALVDGDDLLEESALDLVSKLPSRPTASIQVPGVLPPSFFAEARAKLPRSLVAPASIVDCVEAAVQKATFAQGIAVETALFDELVYRSPQSKALQALFFAERTCSKIPGLDATQAVPVKSAGVVGGGTMGRGIAMCFLEKGIPVVVVERDDAAAQGVKPAIRAIFEASSKFKKGLVTPAALEKKLGLLACASSYEALGDVDIAIEAVFEDLEAKRAVFAALDAHCKPGAVLATNTSTISIDKIADGAASRPGAVVGTHFFSPANVMRLLENVRGARSSDASVATAMALGKTLGKTTVLAGDAFGFIGNRLLEPYSRECLAMLDPTHARHGLSSSVAAIDGALTGHGLAMGFFQMSDLAGNDVSALIRKTLHKTPAGHYDAGAVADALCAVRRFGQKTGKGWYRYDAAEPRKPIHDVDVDDLIQAHFGGTAASNGTIPDDVVVERCMLAMANEGFRVLEEKVALRPSDIDVTMTAGYGLPRHVGGPMHYAANQVGLKAVVKKLETYRDERTSKVPYLEPSNLLRKMASADAPLKDFHKFL